MNSPSANDEAEVDQKPDDERTKERKERVIHARIPPGLEEDLKKLADALRMPVSNLIRNILHDTVSAVDRGGQTVEELVDGVSGHVGKEAGDLRRKWARYEAQRGRPAPEAPRPTTKDPLAAVFGFQPIVLNVAAKCAVCGKELARGARANLGLTDRPGRRVFVCDACVPASNE